MPPAPYDPVLCVKDLCVAFRREEGWVQAVRDFDLLVRPGDRIGLVGESGSGKTVTGLAIMGLLVRRTSRVTGGILLEGQPIGALPERQRRRFRGRKLGMIFQEPMSALDPVFTVGEQIAETLRTHFEISRRAARDRAVALLDSVGIAAPARRIDDYPHQLSGGMRQRAMIAIALACEPSC